VSQTIGAALRHAISCLTQQGVSEPRADAEVLLADLLTTTRAHLYLESAGSLSAAQHTAYLARVQRRRHGEPVQYITGKQEFWSLEFLVTPQVLIPRPESELLVEQGTLLAHQWHAAQPQAPLVLLDVGTGSGNLAISLATTLPQAHVWAVDQSLGALAVARQNAHRLGVAERVHWVCGDLVTALQRGRRPFAVCVANLPYVTTEEWRHLAADIREYEPTLALDGGPDGLACIRRLIACSPYVFAPGGALILEVGWQQAPDVQDMMRQQGKFTTIGVHDDLAGIARVVWGQVV
jgi:release factor glutamine methyltransferase